MQTAGRKKGIFWFYNQGSQNHREGCVQKSVPETEL